MVIWQFLEINIIVNTEIYNRVDLDSKYMSGAISYIYTYSTFKFNFQICL